MSLFSSGQVLSLSLLRTLLMLWCLSWSLAPLKSRTPLSYACVFCVFEVLNMCVSDSCMYLMAFIICMVSVVFVRTEKLYNHRKLV